MTKRERVCAAIEGRKPDHVPAGFSLHFPKGEEHGQAGVESHLRFFRETGLDISKIMNENLATYVGEVPAPADWKTVRKACREGSFVEAQREFAQRVLAGAREEGYFLGTLHGITASAIHPMEGFYGYEASRTRPVEHLREDEGPVLDAMKEIAQRQCQLVRAYQEMGVQGVYYASLGGEPRWFTDEEFARWIAPLDRLILTEIQKAGLHAFLHICKDGLNMERYRDYPADVVNWGVYEAPLSLEEGRRLFPGKTVMGGLANRGGPLDSGTKEELEAEVRKLIAQQRGQGFLLGADCTLPTETAYERIRFVADLAHTL